MKKDKVPKSLLAWLINKLAWIPILGLATFILLLPFVFISFSKGRLGIKLVFIAFVKIIIISLLPVAILVIWGGLDEKYYPDMYLGKHGVYYLKTDDESEIQHFYFDNLIKVESFYKNSNPMCIVYYKNGKRHGDYSWFYDNGQKGLQTRYADGSIDGYQTFWFENGTKRHEGALNNNHYYGAWKGWYESGTPFWIAEYDDEGKQIGKYKVWHENGNIAVEGQYEKGQEVGKWTCYKEDGAIDWETKDYKSIKPKRFFSSKYPFAVTLETLKELGFTPKDKNIPIPAHSNWFVQPLEMFDYKEYYKAIDELRRKHINYLSVPSTRLFIKNLWLENSKCMPVKKLYAGGFYLTDFELDNIKGFQLEKLDISFSQKFTDEGLKYLKSMPLKELFMPDCQGITEKGLAQLKGLPLQVLDLRACGGISKKYRKYHDNPEEIKQMLEDVSEKVDEENKKKAIEAILKNAPE